MQNDQTNWSEFRICIVFYRFLSIFTQKQSNWILKIRRNNSLKTDSIFIDSHFFQSTVFIAERIIIIYKLLYFL